MPAQLGTTGTGRLPHGWVRASSLRAATPGAAEGAGAALVAGPGAHCSTGDACLDALLRGGLRHGAVTELAGESTAGKTQLALQCCAAAALAGGAALCLFSEHDFQSARLAQLVGGLARRQAAAGAAVRDSAALRRECAERTLVRRVDTPDEVLRALRGALPLAERSARACCEGRAPPKPLKAPLRLVVIDSMAAPVREEYDNNARDMRLRTGTLLKISALLRKMADRCGIAVLVTNHVTDIMDRADARAAAAGLALTRGAGSGAAACGGGQGSAPTLCAPALGLTWAHCVHVRLFASRTTRAYREPLAVAPPNGSFAHPGAAGATHAMRRLQVVFAPHLPRGEAFYIVDAGGIRGVTPEDHYH